jgi:hypothetical protein
MKGWGASARLQRDICRDKAVDAGGLRDCAHGEGTRLRILSLPRDGGGMNNELKHIRSLRTAFVRVMTWRRPSGLAAGARRWTLE